ncbi:hypothetical protein BKA67DRAFT_580007 [Truncatella angustata]|uniref:Uncharacterized protein n=1 Tax=Truncatella angustata TaxID=152316 RepID=A0A9P8UBV3_9PEZI|nr:uncharacterized protein BKA67DRAFT_580007 [Truncatella angustata]KAH6646577.1 hypothetical protein BKA67DRAFT_580007 [Truncatella angustata]
MSALVGGLGIFAAMVAVLARQNNHADDDWVFFLNLNSLIALLSTVYRAVMVAVAAEVVSQSKWIYFWTSRSPISLLRLQYFDSASRGIWGAARLLPYAAKRSPATLAAALIIAVSFAVGPFFQQSIGTVDRSFVLEDGTASVPIARNINGSDTWYRTLAGPDYGMWAFKYDVRASILSALSNPFSQDSAVSSKCTSGNCTFPSWESGFPSQSEHDITLATVGMCNQCIDVGSLVTVYNNSLNTGSPSWKLPTGLNVTAFDGANWMSVAESRNLTWAESIIPYEQAATFRWAFANITMLVLSNSNSSQTAQDYRYQEQTPNAVVCSLYPCLRSYSASVTNGKLDEKLISTQPMYPDLMSYTGSDVEKNISAFPEAGTLPGDEPHLAALQSPCLVNETVYTSSNFSAYSNASDVRILSPSAVADNYPSIKAPPQCLFKFNTFFYLMLASYLQAGVFSGNCKWDSRQGTNVYCADKYWLAQFWEYRHANLETITGRFDNFAEAVTRQFRLGLGLDQAQDNVVRGKSSRTKPFTVVNWKWLIFPIALLAIETVLLIWMIARSLIYRGEEMVWKGNVLPLLYHRDKFVDANGLHLGDGIPSHDQADGLHGGQKLMTIAEMENDAKDVRVTLIRNGNGTSEIGNVKDDKQSLRRRRDWDQDSLLGS